MSLASMKAGLAAELVAANLPGVTVFGYEPAAVPPGLTVTVSTAQVTPTDYIFAVRVYVTNNEPEAAQNTLDLLMPLVEAALSDTFGPIAWEVDLDVVDAGNVALGTAALSAPRQDF